MEGKMRISKERNDGRLQKEWQWYIPGIIGDSIGDKSSHTLDFEHVNVHIK